MIIPAGFAQVNVLFTGAGVPQGAQVTFGVQDDLDSNPVTLAGVIRNDIAASNVMGNCSSSVSITGVLVKKGPNATGAAGLNTSIIAGGQSGECYAPNTAYLVRKSTLAGGRAGRGRFYWPGLPEVAVTTGGVLAGTYAADVQARFSELRTLLEDSTNPMVLLHGETQSGNSPDLVTSLTVDSKVGTQRRRLR